MTFTCTESPLPKGASHTADIKLVELDAVVLGASPGIHQCCEVVGRLKLLVEVGSVLDEMFLVVELEALSTDAKEVVLAA